MKKKILVKGAEARARVIGGVHYAADAVRITLGPFGYNYVSGIRGGPVHTSNDGVSLLKEIDGRDEIEDLGVRAVREAAVKTNNEAGDGTTTATILTSEISKELEGGNDEEVVVHKKSTAVFLATIEKEKKFIVEKLTAMAEEITSEEELVAVAKVSVEDEALAKLVGGAQWQVGKLGTVIFEETNAVEDSVEYIHGIRIDNGFSSSRLINNAEKQSLELKDVAVILSNKVFKGNFIPSLKTVFDALAQKGVTDVAIIGRGFDDTAIQICLKNIENPQSMNLYPLNAPYVWQDEIMEDLAAVLGGKYITSNRNLETMVVGDVGHATKLNFKRMEGIVTGHATGVDAHVDNRVQERIKELQQHLKGDVSPFERKQVESRLSQMRSGTALIKVGGETETERGRKKDKVEDAVNAVRASITEGVVRGGGIAYMEIADLLEEEFEKPLLATPLRSINRQILSSAPAGFVIEPWVKDPLKVVRTALVKACDIASNLAKVEVAVNWEREKPQYVTTVDNKIGNHIEEAEG